MRLTLHSSDTRPMFFPMCPPLPSGYHWAVEVDLSLVPPSFTNWQPSLLPASHPFSKMRVLLAPLSSGSFDAGMQGGEAWGQECLVNKGD